MTEPRYPAARAIASTVRSHFARHPASSGRPVPDASMIEAVIDTAFWASLRREEGYIPRISIALLSPDEAVNPMRFERPRSLSPSTLVRVAPAVERPGLHLGVWTEGGELVVWGTTWMVPAYSFVLEVAAPGLLVVKHHRDGAGKFVNVAVLEGDQIKVIDESASTLPECPDLLSSLLGFHPTLGGGNATVLVQLAVSMRAHGRGGTMLIVPPSVEDWRASIVQPVSYSVQPAFNRLARLVSQAGEEPDSRRWQDELNETIAAIAGLTAVDGATVMTDRYELLAFGAKIVRRKGSAPVERVLVTEPVEGNQLMAVHPNELGGTRHLSAIQFVNDQPGTVALVASVDGRFTIFMWSACEQAVHAHRVEALLL